MLPVSLPFSLYPAPLPVHAWHRLSASCHKLYLQHFCLFLIATCLRCTAVDIGIVG